MQNRLRSWTGNLALLLLALAGGAAAAEPSGREVLVLGGAGQLGSEIVRLLVSNGDHVTVMVRAATDRSRLKDQPVAYVIGDLLNDADVAAAFTGRTFAAVVNAVRAEGSTPHFYEQVMPRIVAQAKAAGVAQIIHHGAVGAGANVTRVNSTGWDKVPGLLDRLKDHGIGEDTLVRGGVPYTIIRNARLYPAGTPSTGKAELTEDDTVLTPMTRADLAIFTVRCLGNAACLNKTYHVKDPSLGWPPPGAAR